MKNKILSIALAIVILLSLSVEVSALSNYDMEVFGTFENFRVVSDTSEIVSFNNFYKLFNDSVYRDEFADKPVLEIILEPNRTYSFEFLGGALNYDEYNLFYEITGAQSSNFSFKQRDGNRFYFETKGDIYLDANSVSGAKLKIVATHKQNGNIATFDGDAFADQYIREVLGIDRHNVAEFVIKIGYRRITDEIKGPLIIKQHFANIKEANRGVPKDERREGIVYPLSDVDIIFDDIDTPKTVNLLQGAVPSNTRQIISDYDVILLPFKFNQSLPGKATVAGYIPYSYREEGVRNLYVYTVLENGNLSLYRDDIIVDNNYYEFKIGSTPMFIVSREPLPSTNNDVELDEDGNPITQNPNTENNQYGEYDDITVFNPSTGGE
ncbi:MAG: hypothetical protein IJC83_01795 [Oscillospiraceae bacterium]|nr:hypothetical protein [Oscillospiraceae bacterium]